MANTNGSSLKSRDVLALRGLRLPRITLDNLQKAGIFCTPAVTLEHQRTASQYVLRGQESGGSVADFGAYCGFTKEDGDMLPWLQPVDSLAVNGIHARVVAAGFLRLHIVRILHTYDLLLTRHSLRLPEGKTRPVLESSIVFLGKQGTLDLELWGKDRRFQGKVLPQFFGRSGEPLPIPESLHDAVHRALAGVTCIGCRDVHLLVRPGVFPVRVEESPSVATTE